MFSCLFLFLLPPIPSFLTHFTAALARSCTSLDELLLPISAHLAPRLSDELVLETLSTICKRLEVSIKKVGKMAKCITVRGNAVLGSL